MEPQGLWSIMHTYAPSSLYLFLLSLLHTPGSHFPLIIPFYSKHPPSLPPPCYALLSHSIMLLLDVFSFSFYPYPLSLPLSFFPFLSLFSSFPLPTAFVPLPIALSTHVQFPVPNCPSSFLLPPPGFSFPFHPLLLSSSLTVVSYLSLWRRHNGIYESSLSNSS